MNALLTGLMLWIAANSPLVVPETVPEVLRMDPVQMACLLEYIDPCDERQLEESWVWYAYYQARVAHEPALIVVNSDVDLKSIVGHSVLLHELVHHMQVTAGQKHDIECQAYQLEQKWLQERGSSLAEAFDMGGLFVLLKTSCYEQ